MATPTQTAPAWSTEYLKFAAWTQDELRNLLCGLAPVSPIEAPSRSRQEINDDFVRDEVHRVAADRHIRDAILAGHLKVLGPPDERLLERVRPHVDPEEFDALTRAVAHDRICSKAYRFSVEETIQWAATRRESFPDFPFTAEDLQLPSDSRAAKAIVSDDLKQHRRALVRRALQARDVNQTEFCQQQGISSDSLRGIITGNRHRYAQKRKTEVLKQLGITERDWNTLP